MTSHLQVSVITPVYNAAPFVTQAVESALALPETGELLLIEDGSSDNSLEICRILAEQHQQVKLFQHQDGRNLGAGASRNLGIEQANCEYIAFLDADDLYLPNRFRIASEVFKSNYAADGVYGATGTIFEDVAAEKRWIEGGHPLVTTVKEPIPPEQLFEARLGHQAGSFTTDAIVVRRVLFERSGVFDARLKMCQDSHLWIRMAATGRLMAGEIEQPVSLRRVHAGNRVAGLISQERLTYQRLMWEDLLAWGQRIEIEDSRMLLLARAYLIHMTRLATSRPPLARELFLLRSAAGLVKQWPSVLRYWNFWTMAGNNYTRKFIKHDGYDLNTHCKD